MISLFALAGRVVSTPWNTSLSVLPLSVVLVGAECFRWRSTWFVAASCTCSSWLNPVFILMPDSPERLRNFCRWCSELHGYLRALPDLGRARREPCSSEHQRQKLRTARLSSRPAGPWLQRPAGREDN